MKKSNHVTIKSGQQGMSRRGRPATGIGVQIGMRWQESVLREIDDWRREEEDLPDRPTAIRRLVALGLAAGVKRKKKPKEGN
jgi:hypothetical protein